MIPSNSPQDEAGRHPAGEELERLNRLYAVASAINEAIVRMRWPQELYERACWIAAERGGLVMAWVGLVDARGLVLTPGGALGSR
jgi:hypothetical protein